MTGKRRGARALVGTLTFGMIFGLAGPAPAAAPHRNPATQKRLMQLADSNMPAGSLHARASRSGLVEPTRSKSPEEYLRAAGDLRDPRTYPKAARAMAEATWGITLPDPRASVATPNTDDTIRLGLPGGDLTGDGLDDALSFEYRWGDWDLEFLALRGLRGTDGTSLWSVPISGAYDVWPILAGDLTGDGADDILLTRFDVDAKYLGGCAVVACAIEVDATFTWTYSLISGADGSVAWTKTYDGRVAEAIGFAGFAAGAVAIVYDGTNVFVTPALSGDHTGDGTPDLVFNSYDVRAFFSVQYAVLAFVYEDVALLTTRGEIVSGADGSARLIRTQERVPGGASLLPVGDAVGDATGDLVWATVSDVHAPLACVFPLVAVVCAQVSRQSLTLEMLDGADLTTSWTSAIGDNGTAFVGAGPFNADLTGDGEADLLLSEYRTVEGTQVGVVSGATGATAWSRPGDTFLSVIGPVGGGPGSDLLSIDFRYDGSGAGTSATMERIDGSSGERLLVSSRAFPYPDGGFTDIYAYLPGDTDGDGAIDIAINAISYTGSGETSRMVVESGATAATLLDRSDPGFAIAVPAGDMDADGAVDLLEISLVGTPDGYTLTFGGRSIAAGALWSRTDEFLPCFDLRIAVGGDQSGLGGDDQVYSRLQCTASGIESRISGVEQKTGAITWGYGSTLTAPSALGAISGTITDERGDPVQVCVDVLQPAEGGGYYPSGGSYAEPDGTYRVGGLGAGDYKVAFWDCDSGRLAREFYNDKANIDDADLVPVVLGSVTTGIDAVLADRWMGGVGEPPANDNFADAFEIGTPSRSTNDTFSATLEAGEPDPSCAPSGRTVWYRFTATATGSVNFTTAGSDYDTVLGVYTGSDLASLTEVGCSDDALPFSLSSTVSIPATAGDTYYIQAGGFKGSSGSLILTLA